jgi:catechol 2,3-dioxygenase-like lactoylglutathione lyase family enzyme
MDNRVDDAAAVAVTEPPAFDFLDHVSLPCRDLEDAKRFWTAVMGGTLTVDDGAFAQVNIAGTKVGFSSVGTTFMGQGAEYPHIAFNVGPEALVRMKAWLTACGIPTSDFWTRKGIEALMFFLDPSGNVIEMYCKRGYAHAASLARGPARGHGTAIDVDALRYSDWHVPGR